MYTYLKFGLPRVFPPNASSQRSHRAGPGPGYKGNINNAFHDSSGFAGAGSSGYDSSDNETTHGRIPISSKIRKFRSESDFRTLGKKNIDFLVNFSQLLNNKFSYKSSIKIGMAVHRPGYPANNIPVSALRQANSRASIAGMHLHPHLNGGGGKHYGHRSHSEADLLGGGASGLDTIGRDYQHRLMQPHYASDVPMSNFSPSRRQSAAAMVLYPNIQVHCLDMEYGLRGVSLQAKAGDLFAVMATSSHEGTLLLETLAGLRERLSGEILINGQRISQRGLRNLCSYVPTPDKCSLDPRMSVQSTLNFYATLCGPRDAITSKQQVRAAANI